MPRTNETVMKDMQNMNAPIEQEKNKLRTGHRMLRLWLLGISVIVIVGTLLVHAQNLKSTKNNSTPAKAIASVEAAAVALVAMHNLQFVPATVEVKKGAMIEWTNEDLVPHTATSPSFDSGAILSGQSWHYTFTNAGNYPYRCTFHPEMKGVVIVK
jgi:plastocyanin